MEGGIIMGKTVTSEFAVHYLGPTINPYNSEHTPGTSSSGSAVAVATGMVPLALGTQTAGSIIKPASYCGIYGFKPSFGLLPRTGVLKTVDPLDHVGFFARSVDDMRLMLDAIRVKGVNYPYVCEYLEDKERQNKKKGEAWRVAFVKTHVWSDAESYAKDNILKFIKRVAAVDNVELEEVELPERFNSAHDIHGAIYDKALSYYFKEEYKKSPEAISDIFKEMVERGRQITPDEYSKKLEEQNELTLMLDNFFKDYDVIFATSTAGEAPKREFYMDEKRDTSLIWTMCRAPSINLPLFKGPHGLPFGVQAVSRRYNDYLLLSFLKFLEEKGILTQSEIIFEEKRNKNGLYVRAQS
jgi:Asp-tRNA(Asn)/Glu-tRNA(Gln) amidotransferase A subunit family amidase